MATALGIAQDSAGVGTDPLQLRKIIQARWASTGIVTGLKCSGRSDLRYQLAAGVAVTSRSTADGCTEAYWQGGTTAAVGTGDPSNPRIDVVYLKANDPSQGDADNQVVAGVVQGTPSASPVRPPAPAGSVAVAVMRMPAGATATNAATSLATPDYAIPYGGSMGLLLDKTYTGGYVIVQAGAPRTVLTGSLFVPTRRLIDVGMSVTWCPSGLGSGQTGSGYVDWTLDGAVVRTYRKMFPWFQGSGAFTCDYFEDTAYEIEAGTHTLQLRLWGSASEPSGNIGYTGAGGNGWPGVRLTVKDGGVA
jgi:hypothetical protein